VRLVLAAVLLLCCGTARAQRPAPSYDDVDIAKAHYATGIAYYERSRFADAAHEFEESYRLSHRPELLYNMGKAYDGGGDKARALAAYRRFLAALPDASDTPVVRARVDQLERLVGRLRLTCTIEGAEVRVDGVAVGVTPLDAPIDVNPGTHAVEVAHEGYSTWRANVVGMPGAVTPVDARPASLVKIVRVEVERAPAPPLYKRWWLWTAVGAVVAAGAVTGGVLGARGANDVPPPVAQFPTVR
jgi:tetratricopeptide (TPR) repeat protein